MMSKKLSFIFFILIYSSAYSKLLSDEPEKHFQKRYDDANQCHEFWMEQTIQKFHQKYSACLRALAYNLSPERIKGDCTAGDIQHIEKTIKLILSKKNFENNEQEKNCFLQILDALVPYSIEESDCPEYAMNELLDKSIPEMIIPFPISNKKYRESCIRMISEIYPKFDDRKCVPTDFAEVIDYADEIIFDINVPTTHRNCMLILRSRAVKYSLPDEKCDDTSIHYLLGDYSRHYEYKAFYPNCVDQSQEMGLKFILTKGSENYYKHFQKDALEDLKDKSLQYGFQVYPNVKHSVRKCVQLIFYRIEEFLCYYQNTDDSDFDSDGSSCGLEETKCPSSSDNNGEFGEF